MKTFEEYILTESLEKPFSWSWTYWNQDGSLFMATATAPTDRGDSVVISFDQFMSNDPIDITFSRKAWDATDDYYPMGVNGRGEAFRIFATVLDVIKAFLKEYHKKTGSPVEYLTLSADKVGAGTTDAAASRIKLYDRLIKKFGPRLGAKISAEDSRKEKKWVFTFRKTVK